MSKWNSPVVPRADSTPQRYCRRLRLEMADREGGLNCILIRNDRLLRPCAFLQSQRDLLAVVLPIDPAAEQVGQEPVQGIWKLVNR